jgi:ribosomal protein L24
MEYLRRRATRSVEEEQVFLDAVADEAVVVSGVEEFFDVQAGDDDNHHAEVSSVDDLAFIDDLSFTSFESASSQQEQLVAPSLPTLRPSVGATVLRDLSNSPHSMSVVRNNDFVAGDRVDMIGGKYKGKTGTVVKRTPAKVRVQLDGAEYNAKKPVDLMPHNVRRRDSSAGTITIDNAKDSSSRAVPIPSDDFVTGDHVDIIGGTYKDKTGTVVKRTPLRVQVKLDGAHYSNKTPVYLVPHNVRRRLDGADHSTKKPVDLVLLNVRLPDSSPKTGSIQDAEQSSPQTMLNDDFVTGDRVDIIGGTYKGKTGIFVKRTPARVQVKLDGVDYSAKKAVNLAPHNIMRRVDEVDYGTKKPVDLVPHSVNRQDNSPRTGNVIDMKASSPPTGSSDYFVTGDLVDIVGGTYKNKTGTVVKRTPARVQVKLDGADYSTKQPVNLVPHNVRHRDSVPGTSSVEETEPTLPTFTKFLIPSEVPMSPKDADRSIVDSRDSRLVQTVNSAQHERFQLPRSQELPQTKPSPTPLRSHTSLTAPAQIDTEPALPNFTKHLIPSDMPTSSEDADQSIDDSHDSLLSQTVDSARYGRFRSPRPLEPLQTTPSPTTQGSHASATTPAQIDTEPALPNFTNHLIPSDMPSSSGDADRSIDDSHDSLFLQTVDSTQYGSFHSPRPLEPPQTTPSPTPQGSHASATAPAQIDTEPAGLPTFPNFLPSDMPSSSEDADQSVDDSHGSRLVQTADSAWLGRFQSTPPLEPPQTTPSPTPPGSHVSATAPSQVESKASVVTEGGDEKRSPRIRKVFRRIKRYIKRKRSVP